MITNNRTFTTIILCGAVLAASLVSQPGHAGVGLNGVVLNGSGVQGANLNGVVLNGTMQNGRTFQGASPNGTAPQTAGSDTGSGSIAERVLSIELPPVTVEGSR
jgi:hypothetical protein